MVLVEERLYVFLFFIFALFFHLDGCRYVGEVNSESGQVRNSFYILSFHFYLIYLNLLICSPKDKDVIFSQMAIPTLVNLMMVLFMEQV
jgi:hypothetical protein